ncbi:MAG: ferric reductase-like transmembrane domain-containing protein [Chloroflexi bacterium]|nr:ferric reductase-like transmembrane domain-containing protein [Chloroflexota bacterium]
MNIKLIASGLAVLSVVLFFDNGQLAWIVVRASGYVAILLMVVSMAVGIVSSTKSAKRQVHSADIFEAHRISGYLTLVALVIHGMGLLADNYINIGFKEILVPGASPYRPIPVGIGVIAAYMAVAVTFSFDLKNRLGLTLWRWVHMLSFPLLVFSLVHGILAGTDTPTLASQMFYYACGITVLSMTFYRILSPRRRPATRKPLPVGRAIEPES